MTLPGNLMTTAMAVMPHTDVDEALGLALSLDIPFWPQLPHYNYYEDMYVQAAEHFPGIILDLKERTLRFSTNKFIAEFEETLSHYEEEEYFDVSDQYSVVYKRFLELDLKDRPAIRGQLEGPISFGFFVKNEDDRPILFDDTVRPFLYEFMAKRINIQLKRLKEKNANAFMFMDEPGLQFIFNAMSGYNDVLAKEDMNNLFEMIDRPRGIHLCGNPDWDFLFGFDMDIASIDLYTNAMVLPLYKKSIINFIERGGTIVWGIVPTNVEPFMKENHETLIKLLENTWEGLYAEGLDRELLLSRSLLSPATCCLINPDKQHTVNQAFTSLINLSESLREKYRL